MAAKKKKAKRKKATGKGHAKKGKNICFVIMSFDGWSDEYYKLIYQPAVEAAGLVPRRADDLYRPGTIVADIWCLTKEAKVVLADISGKNPNVLYELGLAHAVAKPAVLVTESMDDVPFDLRSLRVLEYDKNQPAWSKSLKVEITKAIKEALKVPLEAVLPAFLKIKAMPKNKTVTGQDKAILELRKDIDSIRMQMHQYRRRPIPRRISAEAARILIEDGLASSMPDEAIFETVVAQGAPERWTRDEIKRLRSR